MTITTERLDELEAFYANHTFPQPFATHAVDLIAEVRRLQSENEELRQQLPDDEDKYGLWGIEVDD